MIWKVKHDPIILFAHLLAPKHLIDAEFVQKILQTPVEFASCTYIP